MPHAFVAGGGVAATAIGRTLASNGFTVELGFPGYGVGSTYTNQKWKHSGLLYPNQRLARKAWDEMQNEASELERFIVGSPRPAVFFALNSETLTQREDWWREWSVDSWGLPYKRLSVDSVASLDVIKGSNPAGGFEVPDYVIDFPALIRAIHSELHGEGHDISSQSTVESVVHDKQTRTVTGVRVRLGDQRLLKACDLCVVAAGAWSKQIIEASGFSWPDLILRKCIVLVFEGELVPSITTCLDIRRYTGELKDVTLVPFHGKTLAAGTGFVEIHSMEDLTPDPFELEQLRYELYQAFPTLAEKPYQVRICVKTEKRPGGKPNVAPQIRGVETFGVNGLLLTVPGKASFMFDLARGVLAREEVQDITNRSTATG